MKCYLKVRWKIIINMDIAMKYLICLYLRENIRIIKNKKVNYSINKIEWFLMENLLMIFLYIKLIKYK